MSAHETVPADIAAAIEMFSTAAHRCGSYLGKPEWKSLVEASELERKALDAVILRHLRGHAEMKAALERIEQGM